MIYVAGDIHGKLDIERVTDFFELESCVTKLSEADYLILLGDVGICWDGGIDDAYVRSRLEELPVTVLWLDGNHENFQLIDELPVTKWHGGKVQFIGKKIIHLMRGNVYEINDKKIFTFGGGFSIDKMYRRAGISWWEQEMPSEEEYELGRKNLQKTGNKVDYIFSHTVPRAIARKLAAVVYPGEEKLQDYLQEISQNVQFEKWYFGHWHMDCEMDNYVGLYENIVKL